MKSPTLLPTPPSITRQVALKEYIPRVELDKAVAAGKVKAFPKGKTVWYRTREIVAVNESLTAK